MESSSAVSLRITSASLTAASITQILGCKPAACREIGDFVNRATDRRSSKAWWTLESTLQWDESVPEQIRQLAAFLESRPEAALRTLAANCRLELFCTFAPDEGQGGFTLDPDILRRTADLGLEVVIDFWVLDKLWLEKRDDNKYHRTKE